MKLKYYGTAAAEGIPGMFCGCALCRLARERGGKDIRTRSQAAVDDRLLIDFPADTYMHEVCGGLDLTKIHSCLITHSHGDHLYPGDLIFRQDVFAHYIDEKPLTFYCSAKASVGLADMIRGCHLESRNLVCLSILEPYRPVEIEGYTVTPLEADHDPGTGPFIYLISDGSRRMLYAHDTGYFPEVAWEFLEREKPRLDFVSADGTAMDLKGDEWFHGHMSLDAVLTVRKRLEEIGCADEKTVWCVNHFSHNGGLTHEQLSELTDEYGILTAYDGMTVEF